MKNCLMRKVIWYDKINKKYSIIYVLYVSDRTPIPLTSPPFSGIWDHANNPNHENYLIFSWIWEHANNPYQLHFLGLFNSRSSKDFRKIR